MKPITKPVKYTEMAKKLIALIRDKKIDELLTKIQEIKIVNH